MMNTIKEAVEYAYDVYNNHFEGETIPDAIYEKAGSYIAGTLAEYDYAIARGWKYIGHPAELNK